MTTIFTDDFSYSEVDVELGDPSCGYAGRELIFSTDNAREFRLMLNDEQLKTLALILELNGYLPRET